MRNTSTRYWLMKTEPETYSFQNLQKDGKTSWDGVRNYQARNFMREMSPGDLVLIYHSVSEKAVVGTAEITREAYPDPDPKRKGDWSQVDLKPVDGFAQPVTLSEIKSEPSLAELALIRHTRLSVMPIQKDEFKKIVQMGS